MGKWFFLISVSLYFTTWTGISPAKKFDLWKECIDGV